MITEGRGAGTALAVYVLLVLVAAICHYVDSHGILQPWHPITPLSKSVTQVPYVAGISRFIDICWPVAVIASPFIYREAFSDRLSRVAKQAGRSKNAVLIWNCLVGTPFVLAIVLSLALAPFSEPMGKTWGSKLLISVATKPIWFILMAPFVAVGVALLINSLIFTWASTASRIFNIQVAGND